MRTVERTLAGSEVHVIARDATVSDAIGWLNALRIGSLVVVEEEQVVGILTERDILVRILDARRDPDKTRVSEVMSRDLVTIGPKASIEEAVNLMRRAKCRHLPVIEGGQLCGLISLSDVTRALVEERDAEISDLLGYITHP